MDTTIILATLSTIFFGEYIDPTKYVNTALGIEHWINKTPAANPDKLKNLIIKKPITGPIITLPIDDMNADWNEKTLNLVKAIPNDIRIKKIAVYVSIIVRLII